MADDSSSAKLLPFYVLVDVSYSMQGDPLDSANGILRDLLDALTENPILSDKIRIGLIDFSDDARVQLPLCDLLADDVQIPALTIRGGTSYAAAFRQLRKEIEANVTQLKSDGYSVHRPVVFFVSDGAPTDEDHEWRAALTELTTYDRATKAGFPLYPNLVPFGVGGADPRILQSIIHPAGGTKPMRMFMSDQQQSAGQAISAMAEIMISSVLSSGFSMAGGGSGVILPDSSQLPAGINSFTADDEDFL
jgi:uncharacterized protein YegL